MQHYPSALPLNLFRFAGCFWLRLRQTGNTKSSQPTEGMLRFCVIRLCLAQNPPQLPERLIGAALVSHAHENQGPVPHHFHARIISRSGLDAGPGLGKEARFRRVSSAEGLGLVLKTSKGDLPATDRHLVSTRLRPAFTIGRAAQLGPLSPR